MGSTLFRDPQAGSSALTALWMLQPEAFGSLNCVDPLNSVSNYYIARKYTYTQSNTYMYVHARTSIIRSFVDRVIV